MGNTLFEIIFAIAVSLYFVQLVIFTIGAAKKFPRIKEEDLPNVTVVVAARNEEDNILDCLVSLDNLEYPEGKLEILIINDNSTDKTGELISNFIMGKEKFRVIVPQGTIANLKGKANALAHGLKTTKGEIIFTTDADCTVSPKWVKTLASYYTKDVAFVGGFTFQEDETAFKGMQSIDFMYLLTVAAGALNLGLPLAAIGNNMSYRKSVYDEVGGYENIPFSITEDFQLLKSIHSLKKYKCIYPVDEFGLVKSRACADFNSLFWQKKRWGVGGVNSKFIGYLIMAWGYISKAAILLTPLFFSYTALYLCLFKVCVDFFFIQSLFSKLKLRLKLTTFFAFEVYYTIYVLILPFIVLPNRKVKWKGRTF